MIKDTTEQPEEEIHRSGRVLRAGVSVPMELGCVQYVDGFTNLT